MHINKLCNNLIKLCPTLKQTIQCYYLPPVLGCVQVECRKQSRWLPFRSRLTCLDGVCASIYKQLIQLRDLTMIDEPVISGTAWKKASSLEAVIV